MSYYTMKIQETLFEFYSFLSKYFILSISNKENPFEVFYHMIILMGYFIPRKIWMNHPGSDDRQVRPPSCKQQIIISTEIYRGASEINVENYCLTRFRDYEFQLVKYIVDRGCATRKWSESIYHFIWFGTEYSKTTCRFPLCVSLCHQQIQ